MTIKEKFAAQSTKEPKESDKTKMTATTTSNIMK